ncbi:putative AsnC family transcriptional regulator [Caenibius tardaugens NBRC 16725]|uniref:Putative AsnC family transcriptional regulator n=2 Tax=Caenibius TaxID=2827482 RepID=U2YC41_9SPHN|nr:putative AsnC family transcriptional regulator [Caenibius tardaugens NBRC 16725]
MTNQELSEKVGLSPSPCLRRLKQLESSGIITRYVALVNPDLVGLPVTAFVRIRLDQQDDRHLAEFEKAVTAFSEVMECYLMTGDADYQLRVLVSSLGAFEDFLRSKLTRIPGISEVTTSFALRPVVYKTSIPLQNGT